MDSGSSCLPGNMAAFDDDADGGDERGVRGCRGLGEFDGSAWGCGFVGGADGCGVELDADDASVVVGEVFEFVAECGLLGVPGAEQTGGVLGCRGDDPGVGVDAFEGEATVEEGLAGCVECGCVGLWGEFEGGVDRARGAGGEEECEDEEGGAHGRHGIGKLRPAVPWNGVFISPAAIGGRMPTPRRSI